MKKNIFKIIWIISLIIEIIVFIKVDFVYKDTYEIYNSTNYVVLLIIEIINVIFGVLLFKNKENKLIYVLYVIFAIIIVFIPIYHNGNTNAPTGPDSYLMGLAFEERYLDVYGINIIR